MRTLLPFYTKMASPEMMELSFNMDYDILLAELESEMSLQARLKYEILISQLMNGEDVDVESEISALIFLVYANANNGFGDWYTESFGHLSNNTPEQIAQQRQIAIERAAQRRADTIAPKIADTLRKRVARDIANEVVEIDKIAASLGERTAVTESNSAANEVIFLTAATAFGSSSLKKRWITVGDERVRPTHRDVSSRKPIPSEELYLVGDVYMRFPSDPEAFGGNVAGEVVNCRCRSVVLPEGVGGRAISIFGSGDGL